MTVTDDDGDDDDDDVVVAFVCFLCTRTRVGGGVVYVRVFIRVFVCIRLCIYIAVYIYIEDNALNAAAADSTPDELPRKYAGELIKLSRRPPGRIYAG